MMDSRKTVRGRRDYLFLALIVVVGAALRFAAIAGLSHVPESDESAYLSMALNLVGGHEIVDNMGNHAMYNVGYPMFVLAPAFFLFGDELLVARLANLVLGSGSIVLCYLLAREAGAGRIGRLLAAAAWALYLPASVYGVYVAKENLMIPLVLGVMWCALRLAKEASVKVAVLCGLLFGLIALSGNSALSLVGVILLALLFAPGSLRRRLVLTGSMFLVAMAVSAPWMIRNMEVVGRPVLNTNGGFNLYLGNNAAATGWFVSIGDTPRGPSWDALRRTGEVNASETLKKEAIDWMKANPAEFLVLSVKKAAYFWMPPVHEGKGPVSLLESIVRGVWLVQFAILVVCAIAGLKSARLRSREFALLWLAVVCYTAAHMLFYVIFRYREPIMPVLAVIAALAAESLFVNRRQPL